MKNFNYPFDNEVEATFNTLVQNNKIELSLVKRPEQAGQVNDPTIVSSTGLYHIP